MNQKEFENIYFVGIGGIGMSAIARYFHAIGKNVFGYDRTATKLTDALIEEGIKINFEDKLSSIPCQCSNPKDTLIVFTPAIPKEHLQLNYFKRNHFHCMKRAEVLGLLTRHLNGIGVAGTHGKTTVSSLVAHIFYTSPVACNAFLGGISGNYQSNLLLSEDSPWVVLEADEYDKSFLHLQTKIALVTSMDADHLDIYKDKEDLENTFRQYVSQIKPGGTLIYKKGLNLDATEVEKFTYSLLEPADFYAQNLKLSEGFYEFDLVHPKGKIKKLQFSYPGKINVENAVAACSIAIAGGLKEEEIRAALADFKGVRRRFDYQIKKNDLVFIDDYAHHPKELRECIASVRELYPNKKITGIFQPHLYSRTLHFAKEFAESLNLLDEVILMDIYPARELPIQGVDSNLILKNIKVPASLCSKKDIKQLAATKKFEVLLSLGAGDIDRLVEPIRKILLKKMMTK